jgi:hypothetical protein
MGAVELDQEVPELFPSVNFRGRKLFKWGRVVTCIDLMKLIRRNLDFFYYSGVMMLEYYVRYEEIDL